jgi:glycosyltransferase involved in cell wall biosynthesis
VLLNREKDAVFFMQRLNYHTLAPLLVSLLRKNRFVFDCDDWNIRENPVYYFGIYPSSKMEFLTRRIAQYANVCIVASVFLKDYIRRFNKKVYYIPTGVDTEVFKPKNNYSIGGRITFSWTGTVYHKEMQENVKFILACFSELADKYNDIFLNLAGEGRYFQEIKNYLCNFRCKDRIMVDDWIPPDKIPEYLQHIDIGLLPLTQDTKFNRAKSPTKLFEYMAMAKPTVSSYIGEASHIIHNGENGFLAKTKEEFIEKMQRLIEDSDMRRSMGEKARLTVEESYSLKFLGKRLYEILETL